MSYEKDNIIIEEQSYYKQYDILTNTYNYVTFLNNACQILQKNLNKNYLIVWWNIVDFKLINDVIGFEKSNSLIIECANKLKAIASDNGIVSRVYADNFVMLIDQDYFNTSMVNIEISQEEIYKRNNLSINFAVGIYKINDINISVEKMCDYAELAMKKIKHDCFTNYFIYDEELSKNLIEEKAIISDIIYAFENNCFIIYYQPIFSMTKNKAVGAEALVRMLNQNKELISPSKFIPVLEKNRYITKLDLYVFEQVCIFLKKNKDSGKILLPISVNLSKITFLTDGVFDKLMSILNKYQIEPKYIHIEITETTYYYKREKLILLIEKFKSKGFLILMDDFGSGYSSLNMLKEVPVDMLKIDMNFLNGFETSTKAGNILTSIVRMAKWINLPVIMEGVETISQLDFLKSIGCDMIQGYYFSKPLPEKEFISYIKNNKVNIESTLNLNIVDKDLDILFNSNKVVTKIINTIHGGLGLYSFSNNKLEAIRVNESYFNLFGYTPQTFYKDSNKLIEKFIEADRSLILNTINQVVEDSVPREIFVRRYHTSGNIVKTIAKFCLISKTENDAILCAVFNEVSNNITNNSLLNSNKMLELIKLLFNDECFVLFEYDVKLDLFESSVLLNDKSRKDYNITNFLSNYLINGNDYILKRYRDVLKNMMTKASIISDSYFEIFKAKFYPHQDSLEWYKVDVKSVENKNGEIYKIVGKIKNINKEITTINELKLKAEIDTMSGYLNRNTSETYLNNILSNQKKLHGNDMAMLFDIDDFKKINDLFGHIFGDKIISKITTIVKNNFTNSIACRLGGDEFLIIFSRKLHPDYVELMDKTLKNVNQVKDIYNINNEISISIGAVVITKEINSFEKLYKELDFLLYKSKNSGRNKFTVKE